MYKDVKTCISTLPLGLFFFGELVLWSYPRTFREAWVQQWSLGSFFLFPTSGHATLVICACFPSVGIGDSAMGMEDRVHGQSKGVLIPTHFDTCRRQRQPHQATRSKSITLLARKRLAYYQWKWHLSPVSSLAERGMHEFHVMTANMEALVTSAGYLTLILPYFTFTCRTGIAADAGLP